MKISNTLTIGILLISASAYSQQAPECKVPENGVQVPALGADADKLLFLSLPDYKTGLSFAEKEELKKKAKAWLSSLSKSAFASCEGQGVQILLDSKDAKPDEVLIRTTYLNEDSQAENGSRHSYSDDTYYLSPVELNDNRLVMHSPIGFENKEMIQKGLKVFDPENKVKFENLRAYLIIEKDDTTTPRTLNIRHMLVNKTTGESIPVEEQIGLEDSPIIKCKLDGKKPEPLFKLPIHFRAEKLEHFLGLKKDFPHKELFPKWATDFYDAIFFQSLSSFAVRDKNFHTATAMMVDDLKRAQRSEAIFAPVQALERDDKLIEKKTQEVLDEIKNDKEEAERLRKLQQQLLAERSKIGQKIAQLKHRDLGPVKQEEYEAADNYRKASDGYRSVGTQISELISRGERVFGASNEEDLENKVKTAKAAVTEAKSWTSGSGYFGGLTDAKKKLEQAQEDLDAYRKLQATIKDLQDRVQKREEKKADAYLAKQQFAQKQITVISAEILKLEAEDTSAAQQLEKLEKEIGLVETKKLGEELKEIKTLTQDRNILRGIIAKAAAKLQSDGNLYFVHPATDARKKLIEKAFAGKSGNVEAFEISLRDKMLTEQSRILLGVVTDPTTHITSLHIGTVEGAPLSPMQVMALPLIRHKTATGYEMLNLATYISTLQSAFTTAQVQAPGRSHTQDLKDFPLMLQALQREGLVTKETDLNQLKAPIVEFPTLVAQKGGVILGAVMERKNLEDAFAPNLPESLRPKMVKKEFGDSAPILTIYEPHEMNEHSDVLLHELVHVMDYRKALPSSKQTGVFATAESDKKRLEEKFEKEAFPEIVKQFQQSAAYRSAFNQFKTDEEVSIRMDDAREKIKAENAGVSSEQVEQIIDGHVRPEFEKKAYGENFEKLNKMIKSRWVYLNNPSETLAWKTQVSYLKHEKKMSLENIIIQLNRSAGGTAKTPMLDWEVSLYRKWYDDAK